MLLSAKIFDMKYIKNSSGSIIKDIITLVQNSDGNKIFVSRLAQNRLSWYFNRESNWKIYPNITIEVSTSPRHWPRLCILKENNIVKKVFPATKLNFLQKYSLWRTIRKFSKKMRAEQDVLAYVEPTTEINIDVSHNGIDYG
jgi:hypothetical protein